jgi:parvulin-like peptidyl-prolyl isomerase
LPKKRRNQKIPTPVWERERPSGVARHVVGRSPQFYATLGIIAIVIVALGIVGYAFAADYIADLRRPGSIAIKIEDREYTVRYYTERLRQYVLQLGGPTSASAEPSNAIPALSDLLIQEALILRFAAEEGLSASEEDVNEEIANTLGIEVNSIDFENRLQEELFRTGLTEDEYREMMQARILRRLLLEKITAELPKTEEAVLYRQILVRDQLEADDIVDEVEAGADFAEIARERSLDTTTKDQGGEVGWVFRGQLDKGLEDTIFALEPGEVTIFPTQSAVFVLQVAEKDPARSIEEDDKRSLAEARFREWVTERQARLSIVNEMDLTTGNADKIRYAINKAYGDIPQAGTRG